MRYLSCDPRAETLGASALLVVRHLKDQRAGRIMEKYGLPGIRPGEWIPAHRLLDALNEIGQEPDPTFDAVALGIEVGKTMEVAIADPSLADMLMAWNAMYQSLHRNADVGRIVCDRVDTRHYQLTFTDLYADDFNYGLLYGFAQRFLPAGTHFTIYYDPGVTPRDRGGRLGYTVIHIRWG